jgi:hypothetical protein
MLLSSANKTSLDILDIVFVGSLCIEGKTKDQELYHGEYLVY